MWSQGSVLVVKNVIIMCCFFFLLYIIRYMFLYFDLEIHTFVVVMRKLNYDFRVYIRPTTIRIGKPE